MSQSLLGNTFLRHLKEGGKHCYLHITVASGEGKERVPVILGGMGWSWRKEGAVVHP